ncbi:hypothetical protein D9M72_402810 [compost metagenome]
MPADQALTTTPRKRAEWSVSVSGGSMPWRACSAKAARLTESDAPSNAAFSRASCPNIRIRRPAWTRWSMRAASSPLKEVTSRLGPVRVADRT